MPLSQNWMSDISWLFKKNENSMSNLYENKKEFVEIGAIMALK